MGLVNLLKTNAANPAANPPPTRLTKLPYVLEDAGYECTSYTDPVRALQEFRIDYYDLILLDIKMPVLNGFELCKKIREVDKITHIVFITASEKYYEKFRRQHFPELGKINYIQKPIANDELVRIVDMIVANSITTD